MRSIITTGLVAMSLALAACSGNASPAASSAAPPASAAASSSAPASGSPATSAAAGASDVTIAGFAFSPATLSVKAGTEVTFTNNDSVAHTVTADDNSFDSNNVAQGATFKHTFTTAGTVAYHCKIHPNMKATITVTG